MNVQKLSKISQTIVGFSEKRLSTGAFNPNPGGGNFPTLSFFPEFPEKLKNTLHLVFFTSPNFYLRTSEKYFGYQGSKCSLGEGQDCPLKKYLRKLNYKKHNRCTKNDKT